MSEELIKFFPEAATPIILSQDTIEEIRLENEVLPQKLIEAYIKEWEEDEVDEFTEFMPCFKLNVSENFTTLVYWKAQLLRYEYIMVNLNKKFQLLARKSISSTIVENNLIKNAVCTIDNDFNINIMAGIMIENQVYDPTESQSFSMEILDNGEIVLT